MLLSSPPYFKHNDFCDLGMSDVIGRTPLLNRWFEENTASRLSHLTKRRAKRQTKNIFPLKTNTVLKKIAVITSYRLNRRERLNFRGASESFWPERPRDEHLSITHDRTARTLTFPPPHADGPT